MGVATQDKRRQRALVVPDKATRVTNFHRNTLKALAEMTGAAGLDHPGKFMPQHFIMREKDRNMVVGDEVYPYMPIGFLLREDDDRFGYLQRWRRARAQAFEPVAHARQKRLMAGLSQREAFRVIDMLQKNADQLLKQP